MVTIGQPQFAAPPAVPHVTSLRAAHEICYLLSVPDQPQFKLVARFMCIVLHVMASSSADLEPSSHVIDCNCIIESVLIKPFGSRSSAERTRIVLNDRPTPALNNLKTKASGGYNRHFNSSWYADYSWLCGCSKLMKLFCWPCLLFPIEKCVWNTSGVENMDNFRVLRGRHENSKQHIASMCSLAAFGKARIEFSVSEAFRKSVEKHNENVKKHRYIMTRLISTTCFLAQQELPFQGINEIAGYVNKDNNVELLHLLAETDDQLCHHLQTSTVVSEISNDIQNAIIECVSNIMINEIKKEVKDTHFVAIVMDETTHVSNRSQISTILRYVTQNGNVEERFIGFTEVGSDRTASQLCQILFEYVDNYQCGDKVIAQTYDGAPVMSGEFGGLQTLVKQRYSQALFIHCYSHKLNVILQKSVSCIKECKVFFENVSGFSEFFTKSSKRTKAFDREVGRHSPTVSDIRLNYRSGMIDVIYNFKSELAGLFKSMMENTEEWDAETRACASGFFQTLKCFEFNFLLEIFSIVFPKADILFNILQNKINDIAYCKAKTRDFIRDLTTIREDFNVLWSKIAESNNAEMAPRSKRMKVTGGEATVKDLYQYMFYEIMDTLKGEVTLKFSDIEKLEFLALLDSDKFANYSQVFPELPFTILLENYGQYFSAIRLKNELAYVYSSSEFITSTIYELNEKMHVSGLATALPEVTKLCALNLTISATSASANRSFSALRRIQTYQRSTRGQNIISNLSLMAIEKDLLRNLKKRPQFYDSITDLLAQKIRRIDLTYK